MFAKNILSIEEPNTGFGTFSGVFVPNITMMCGIILFLRLGFVVGNVGLYSFLGIILISIAVMSITALSIAMVCSNMRVGGGGAYYLISRSLGVEFGGAVGLALILNQLLCMALCISGFAQSLNVLIPEISIWIAELATLIVLALLAVFSTELVLKTQTLIFVCLVVSVSAIFAGGSVSDPLPFTRSSLSFWTAFAIFYPAMTGIEVGMSLSGTLKNPSKSITWGTLLSIATMAIVYSALALSLWYTYPRGSLAADPNILMSYSKFPALIYFGAWCASLSSAIGNFIGAPRMIQTVAQDGILPHILSKGYGAHQEPRWAIISVFGIGIALLMATTIDQLLPMLTMICLLTYGTLNLVAGLAEWLHNPSWRPTFRCPWQLCLLGSGLCFFLMMMIEPAWAMISICLILTLFLYLSRQGIQTTFNDFREGLLISISRFALYKLFEVDEKPQNWIPKVLICARSPMPYEKMIHLGHAFTKRTGILTIASILPQEWENPDQLDRMRLLIKDWLDKENVRGINEVSAYSDFFEGVSNYAKSYGIGSLQPNCVMLNFPEENEMDSGFLHMIETMMNYQKNLLLFNFPEESAWDQKKKTIHLWWDYSERESSELLLSLLLCLRQSRRWQKRRLVVHSMASDENAKKYIEQSLKELFKERRLPISTMVHIDPRLDPLFYISHVNKNANLVLLPFKISESANEQRLYFDRVRASLPNEIPFLGAACFEMMSHKEIYNQINAT